MNFELVLKTALSNIRYGRRSMVKVEDAIAVCRDWCSRLPMRYDLIVGVPRAGLLFANFMSMELSIPLATPDTIENFWQSKVMDERPIRNILIVEDVTKNGTQALPLKRRIQLKYPMTTVHIGSVFKPEGGILLDTFGAEFDGRSLAEWDLLDEEVYSNVAVDMDGVLCQDPPSGITEARFDDWARNVPPYLVPRFRIRSIITSRLERSRELTDEWLRRNGVKYYNLLCDPSRTLQERDLIGWKVNCINWRKPEVFIESDDRVAREVHWRTGVPVISVSTMEIYSK